MVWSAGVSPALFKKMSALARIQFIYDAGETPALHTRLRQMQLRIYLQYEPRAHT